MWESAKFGFDPSQGMMESLQKSQNKLFRMLNETRISDKISTKSIPLQLNMLSVNQINAQLKLTEMWKAKHVPNYPIKLEKRTYILPPIKQGQRQEVTLFCKGKMTCVNPHSSTMHPKSGTMLLALGLLRSVTQFTKQRKKFENMWLHYLYKIA